MNIPTIDEVRAYANKAGITHVNPEEWLMYWSGRSWSIDGRPMRDWKRTIRNREMMLRHIEAKKRTRYPENRIAYDAVR